MSYVTYRIRRKTASGYDIYHIESNSNLILRFDDDGTENGTVEEALRGIEETLNALTGGGGGSDPGGALDVTNKIDKVSPVVANNFPALNEDGTLHDSGTNMHTFAPAEHTHRGNELQVGVPSVVVTTGEDGFITSTGVAASKLNDITKVEASSANGKIKIDGTDTDVYTHPTVTADDTTDDGALAYGGTFTAVTAATVDGNGHVTGVNTRTYQMPAAPIDIRFVDAQPSDQKEGDLWFQTVV